jgi:hypothetical protein
MNFLCFAFAESRRDRVRRFTSWSQGWFAREIRNPDMPKRRYAIRAPGSHGHSVE